MRMDPDMEPLRKDELYRVYEGRILWEWESYAFIYECEDGTIFAESEVDFIVCVGERKGSCAWERDSNVFHVYFKTAASFRNALKCAIVHVLGKHTMSLAILKAKASVN